MKQVTIYIRDEQFDKLQNEDNKSQVVRDGLDMYYNNNDWNKEKFWNRLSKQEKEMAKEICEEYKGNDGAKGRIFKLYQEGAEQSGMTIDEYSKMFSPAKYVQEYYKIRNQ